MILKTISKRNKRTYNVVAVCQSVQPDAGVRTARITVAVKYATKLPDVRRVAIFILGGQDRTVTKMSMNAMIH